MIRGRFADVSEKFQPAAIFLTGDQNGPAYKENSYFSYKMAVLPT